jgi:hypothetical protein
MVELLGMVATTVKAHKLRAEEDIWAGSPKARVWVL